MVPKRFWSPLNGSRSLPTFPRPISTTGQGFLAQTASTMRRNAMSISVQQAKNCVLIDLIPPSVRCIIGHAPKTAITVRSKHSVRPAHKDAASVAVSMKRCWIASEAIRKPKPTKRRIVNARSGSNPYLQRAKTGMACDASACGGTGLVNCEALMRAAGHASRAALAKTWMGTAAISSRGRFCLLFGGLQAVNSSLLEVYISILSI